MKETVFIQKNAKKWKRFEDLLANKFACTPDERAALFVQLTDDLSYAKTFYPSSKVVRYLNNLTAQVHQSIYKNKREERGRVWRFWRYELPQLMKEAQRPLLVSFVIFSVAIIIGALSAANDASFVRLILGDYYVNMTLENIDSGKPLDVYGNTPQMDMFLGITMNNIRVSFVAFVLGIFGSLGTAYVLLSNGIMLGAFQYFFYQKGLLLTSFLTIWIHGALEISAIVLAGCAGFVMGNSLLFPKTYTRLQSFQIGANKGLKIVLGLVPIFIIAGFLESFVTRHYQSLPDWIQWGIILISFAFILAYFVVYPRYILEQK